MSRAQAIERSAALAASRGYAHSALGPDQDAVVAGCVDSVRRLGFCVLDHVIPPEQAAAVRHECVEATPAILDGLRTAPEHTLSTQTPAQASGGGYTRPNRHVATYLPLFAAALGHPALLGIARSLLDPHVRVAQMHVRHVGSDMDDILADRQPQGGAGRLRRGWHTCAPPYVPPPTSLGADAGHAQ